MDSSKNLCTISHYFFTIFFSLTLTLIIIFFFSYTSPATSAALHRSPATKPPPEFFPGARLAEQRNRATADSANQPSTSEKTEETEPCDLFDGRWIVDEDFDPFYDPGSCPFVDESFDCFKNGRPDSDYIKLKWKPRACEIPRFEGLKMLKMLQGKRMVFVGDSLNRNMWESLICSLRKSLIDKSRVFEVSGRHQFRSHGFYSFIFKDFNCSIDFVRSPFLVQQLMFSDKAGTRRETLRLDTMEGSYSKYLDADIIVFNTGHWWTHQKTFQRKYYFQEGDYLYKKLEVAEAYKKALKTWAKWVDTNINISKTRVFFRGYSSSHFKGGQWNSGGSCDGETKPITNEAHLGPYPWMMKVLESVLSDMKTPVFYLNITRMTDYRKDGHPSIFRESSTTRKEGAFQDCSHWCLPGVPDSWNELLYAFLVKAQKKYW